MDSRLRGNDGSCEPKVCRNNNTTEVRERLLKRRDVPQAEGRLAQNAVLRNPAFPSPDTPARHL